MGSDKKCSFSVLDNRSTLQIVFNFPPQDANSQQTARKVFCCSSFHSFDCLTDYTLRSLRGGRGGLLFIMSTEAVRNDLPVLGAHYYKEN